MRERLYRVEAIVLKRTDYGEADRLVTLLTPNLGKLREIAKGVRKPTSRKSGHLELFTHTHLLLAKGKQLDIITQADTLDAFLPLRNNLERIGYAYYLAELVDKFAEEGTENRALFDELLRALAWLGETTTDPDVLARFFELRVLQYAGYRPQLFNCVHCGKSIEPTENYFSVEAGGVLDPECVQTRRAQLEHAHDAQVIPLDVLKVLRYLQTREWATVRDLCVSGETMLQVETVMLRYITYHLERNLKSVEFLRELKARKYVANE
ncbi:MAG: DNA repair protein RecO [Anaerolineae bacterium]|nr:DNA repair protein RecO [Anaerolineae bacterium]